MRILTRGTLRDFWEVHPQSKVALNEWYHEVKSTTFENPHDFSRAFSRCSILPNGRIVFRISGNKYRLVVRVAYNRQAVYVCFIGTHGEYDKIDAHTVYIR